MRRIIIASILSALIVIDSTSALNSVLDINGLYPYLIDNVTGVLIEPRDYMDFENIYVPNGTYRKTQTAQSRNYHLIKAFDFANYFQSDYWHYTSEDDLKLSAFPVANETLCAEHLNWIERQLNVSGSLFARGEQHATLMALMDSFGRPETSTYQGHVHWLGSYHECKNINLNMAAFEAEESGVEVVVAKNGANQNSLRARYCVGKVRDIDWPTKEQDSYVPQISYKIGLCLPESCETLSIRHHQSQIQRLMRFNMPNYMRDRFFLQEMYCLPDERSPVRSLGLSSRIYLVICSTWLIISLASTWLYFCYRYHQNDLSLKQRCVHPDSSSASCTTADLKDLVNYEVDLNIDSRMSGQIERSENGGAFMAKNISDNKILEGKKFILPPPHPLLASRTMMNAGIQEEVLMAGCDHQSLSTSNQTSISSWFIVTHPVAVEFLKALDIIQNIVDFQKPPGVAGKLMRVNLNALDAIKCLCCVLVIFGHIVFIHMQHISNVVQTIEKSNATWPRVLIAFFNFVDTFFIISGMLTTYFLFKRFNKNTLVYLLVLWFTKTVAVHIGEGPLWDYGTDKNSIHGLCINDHWWKSILYLGNWATMQPLCILPAWSIIVDSQYSLILPPIIFLLMKHKRLGYLSLLMAVVVSTTNMSIQLANQTAVKAIDMAKIRLHVYPLISRFAAEFYNSVWNRVGPVAIGIIGGHMLYLYDIGAITRWPWFMRGLVFKFILSMHVFIFILPTIGSASDQAISSPEEADLTVFLLSNAAIKPIWSFINTVLLLRLITDLRSSSFIARLMSHNIWHCLGKLCFASYLIHYEIIILLLKYREDGLIQPTWLNTLREFSLTFLISTILAYLIHVLYEAPINKLVMLAVGKSKLETKDRRSESLKSDDLCKLNSMNESLDSSSINKSGSEPNASVEPADEYEQTSSPRERCAQLENIF